MRQAEPELITLSNGLRLVHLHQRASGAGFFGIAVRAGSSNETEDKFGLAHFVEHTIFKGTRRRSSWHVINRMETVGGELNAFTTKEETVVYSVFPSGCAARAIELIADLASESQFPARELDKEREVVTDEINSYRDTPSEAIYDDFEEYFYAGTPLAHNILGTPESVKGLDSGDCRKFLRDFYTADNMVAFYSGPQALSRIAPLAEKHFYALPARAAQRTGTESGAAQRFDISTAISSHQCHCLLGAGVPGLYSDKRHAVSLLANIIGGPGMNSLLNVALRERRGLVYSVEASQPCLHQAGCSTCTSAAMPTTSSCATVYAAKSLPALPTAAPSGHRSLPAQRNSTSGSSPLPARTAKTASWHLPAPLSSVAICSPTRK